MCSFSMARKFMLKLEILGVYGVVIHCHDLHTGKIQKFHVSHLKTMDASKIILTLK
jgi:hypothetical protein